MTYPLSVVVDASSLTGVAAGSGIGTYTRNLLASLANRADIAPVAMAERTVVLPAAVDRIPFRRLGRRPRAVVIEHAVRMPFELYRSRPEGAVFHNPSYHAPLGVGSPWVQTLLDVIPLVFDAPDQAVLRARWKRFGPRYRHADLVIAISHHAAREGIRVLHLDPARVLVAPLGVDSDFQPGPQSSSERGPGGGGRPYILVVGEYSRRKGFGEAFALADDLTEAGYPHDLVVAGRIHDWAERELRELHASARHPERIHIRGFVDDLVALYQQASVFVMPSHYEGFGLPCLEAMACGTPVVSFNNSSLTEVVGNGGVLVPDGDVGALTKAVRNLLDNPAAADEQAAAGIVHSSRFTWAASAEVHAEAYHRAAAPRTRREVRH